MKEIKKILKSPEEFREYKEKLNEVSGSPLPHEGEPVRFPALAITEFRDDQLNRPCWSHLFIYSSFEDLAAISERVVDESLVRIAVEQAKQPVEIPLSEWDTFWNEMEKLSPPEVSDVAKQEEDDFLVVRNAVGKRDHQDIFFAVNWFMRRWPSSQFKSTMLMWLDGVDMNKVNPKEPAKEVPPHKVVAKKEKEVRFAVQE